MAKRGYKRNDIVEEIEELVENILGSQTLSNDALDRISNRADNVKKLVRNGSERNWNTEDPREVTQLISIVLEEYIYATFDPEDHKDLASKLVKIVEDEDHEPASEKKNFFKRDKGRDEKKNKKSTLDRTTETYFDNFYDFLKSNKITTRPSFATFVKCIEKFNLRKQCMEPSISTQNLFNQWDSWVINR